MKTNNREAIRHVPFVDLGAQHSALRRAMDRALKKVIRKGDFILGEDVASFESEFAAFCDARFAIGVDSGTSALELLLRAHGVTYGDEVITAANSFIATALAISQVGAKPVLADVDPQTYTIDVASVERAITSRTKAILPVHLYGHPADMQPILELAHQHRLVVIEDACQAHGARYQDKRTGSLADGAAFSFYPSKNLGALGDGGMIVTNHEHINQTARMLRNYGEREKYLHEVRGYNRRLDTIQAAVLRLKLANLDQWNAARVRHAAEYSRTLADAAVLPFKSSYADHVYHLFVIRIGNRDEMRRHLSERGIATGVHYPVPIHLQPAFRDLGYRQGDFPVAERYAGEILSLPMHPGLTLQDISYVCDAVRECARPCQKLEAATGHAA
jgi:dTDP-4-amino-4,6-dideoxygalactose transaminase